MKINGMNVVGVKHLAGILKGLDGYGLHTVYFSKTKTEKDTR